jgi:hypothetical protein
VTGLSVLPLTRGCNCGAVRFEVTEPPLGTEYRPLIFVRIGSIDGDPKVRPTVRQHVAGAAVWERFLVTACVQAYYRPDTEAGLGRDQRATTRFRQ